jgi:hypothetical protein
LVEQNKAKLVKTIQQPGYEKTAKDEVRQQNQERVSDGSPYSDIGLMIRWTSLMPRLRA